MFWYKVCGANKSFSPIEKRLTGVAFTPLFVVQMQVMPITMPWIDLQTKIVYEKKKIKNQNEEKTHFQRLMEITASIQCWKANFCAFPSFDNPLPTFIKQNPQEN